MRRFVFFSVLVLVSTLVAAPAVAADPADVIDELELRNYAAESGTSIGINDMEELVRDAEADERDLYFVLLRTDPSGGNDLFAADLIELGLVGSIVVISPNEIGAASTEFDNDTVDDAIDDAFDDFADRDDLGAFRTFAESLPGGHAVVTTDARDEPVPSGAAAESGGGGGFLIFLLIIVAVVGLMLWRNSRRDKSIAQGRLDEAKVELRGQLDVIANEILDLSDRVTVSENDEALAFFRTANDTYSEVSDAAEKAATLADLETLSDRLDQARWQLEAAEALIEGRAVPPEPEDRPAHCFFDPAHRAGVEEAEIKTPAGSKMVGVCRDCAAKLRKGETPTPRSINVGGRPVPAPRAPRSYGGGGLDWLGAFSILLGGRGTNYNLGRTRGVRRSSGGSILGRLGSRSSSTAPIGGSSRRSSTSSRSSRPRTRSSKVTGRSRRRR